MSNNKGKPVSIFFNPNEATVIGLALASLLENLNDQLKDSTIPWTPESRKQLREMFDAAKAAANKLEKFTGIKCNLPPYVPGDENEFFTKQS